MRGFVSRYIREQKRYTKNQLKELFDFSEAEVEAFLKRLKSFGIVKTVSNTAQQSDLSDLSDFDQNISDETAESGECLYVFTYVGVLTLENRIVKCYPKYIADCESLDLQMKQVLKVLQRYNAKEQIINMYNGDQQQKSFNLLAVMLFLLDDYLQNGAYTNTEDIVEVNGEGAILWNETISNGFSVISNNRPYYLDLYTSRSIDDECDFFHRLHKCIVSECSKQLQEAGLLYLFDLTECNVSDGNVDEYGDVSYILYRIQSELGVQYNTHKQVILKTLYAYLANKRTLADNQGLSMYGTTAFHMVWENVCAEVFSNMLNHQLRHLPLPNGVSSEYNPMDKLIDIIDHPMWAGCTTQGTQFVKKAEETLIPDLITIVQEGDDYSFIIFDAKYYCIQLENNRPLRNQPGVGDVTKQYMYQLAYRKFLSDHAISTVRNCFLMPTEGSDIISVGTAYMAMLDDLELQAIQIRQLPAVIMYDLYLQHKTMPVSALQL